MRNYFADLAQVNVNENVEKKGQFSYLSWPFAVAQLRRFDPEATWEVRRFQGLPYLKTETGYFVEVSVRVQGITLSQIHPVLDAKNRPLGDPTCFEINASIQRALVKAIALHGLGLYIYAGEDLPGEGSEEPSPPQPKAPVAPMPSAPTARASAAQLRYLTKLIEETGTELNKLLDYYGATELHELTMTAASRAIKSLENRRAA